MASSWDATPAPAAAPGAPAAAASSWDATPSGAMPAAPAQWRGENGEPDLPIGTDYDETMSRFFTAGAHHAANFFHNTAQAIENAAGWAAEKVAGPDNPITRTAEADKAAMRQREAQYQASQGGGPGTAAGAVVGEALPWIAGAGGKLASAGEDVANAATEAIPRLPQIAQRVISYGTQGALAAPAVTPGGSQNYGSDLGKTAATGAAVGSAIPVATGTLGWLWDNVAGVLRPLFRPAAEAERSLQPLVESTASAAQVPEAQRTLERADSTIQPPLTGAPRIPEAQPAGRPPTGQVDPGIAPPLSGAPPLPAPGAPQPGRPLPPSGQVPSDIRPPIPGGPEVPPAWKMDPRDVEEMTPDNFAALRTGRADPTEYVPGSKPTTAQVNPSADTVAAEKVMRNGQFATEFQARDAANNAARWNYLNQYTKSPAELQALRTARDTATAPLRAQVFQNPVDTAPASAQLDALEQSSLGVDPVVANGIKATRATLDKFAGFTQARYPGAPEGYIAPDALDAVRQNLRDILRSGASDGIVPSKSEAAFTPIKNAITDSIEGANPGYRNYLATYAQTSAPLNSAETANAIRDRLAAGGRDVNGNPLITLNGFNSALKQAGNREYGLTPDAQKAMLGIQADLQRASISNAMKFAGSDTAYNLQAPNWLSGKFINMNDKGDVGGLLTKVPLTGNWLESNAKTVNRLRAQALLDPDYFSSLVKK